MFKRIAVIDFGGQYTHLIARRIRQLGIYSDIYQPEDFFPEKENGIVGIIFSGGPKSVADNYDYSLNFDIEKLEVPLLGICYGHQLIASLVGGNIEKAKNKEYGLTYISCLKDSPILRGLNEHLRVWMSHGDNVMNLPDSFDTIASSDSVNIAAYHSIEKDIYGVQFHPEVVHTEQGMQLLDNFVSLCVETRDWKVEDYEAQIIYEIKELAGDKNLFLLLSGGVDSIVALMLCIKAVGGDRVYPLHIDTGFMRKGESEEIERYFVRMGIKNFKLVDASEKFFKALKNVIDPEEKRNIIGRLFVEVMNEEVDRIIDKDWLLVQGTIYPDTIESGSGKNKADKIKTHHNRVEEIEKLIEEDKVIEPLKELYKDEVRKLGTQLGLPDRLVHRHPFPGPGLAIRIIASNTDKAPFNYDEEETELKRILTPYQMEGFILPVRSVGVQGDFRTYHYPALVWHKKPLYADFTDLSEWKNIKVCANRVVNKLKSVNRVVFSIEPIRERLHLKPNYLEKREVDLLREVDNLITAKLKHIKEIWQMPVVSLPLFDEEGRQVFLMRPVTSQDAMTADVYEMNFNLMKDLTDELKEDIKEIAYLLYDVTTKPPATIEWE
ncbi:MAG: glutamine-hydrolyzing GMP synthase [Spirochaetota bacterium]